MTIQYISTRNKNVAAPSLEALLQGLCDDGGLYVLENFPKIDMNQFTGKSYFEMAKEIFKHFIDLDDQELEHCIQNAYSGKFEKDMVYIQKTSDCFVAELFNGPTSAFKDYGLQILSWFTSAALQKTNKKEDVLILTATSGDTGKASMEGFRDVDRCKVIVFYPYQKVSEMQRKQMVTSLGANVTACAIKGNFDDAQNAVKRIFNNPELKAELKEKNIVLSSANSINIGRLLPQIVYYFYVYFKLAENKEINVGDEVNFTVPTGNFGNILAGYYAKMLGLPIHELICASNSNNVLTDFITTGTYNKIRPFNQTLSPSMDILISSNLERFLFYLCDKNNEAVNDMMTQLNSTGTYTLDKQYLDKMQEILKAGYCDDKACQNMIQEVYKKDGYLLDPHTAVGYRVLLDRADKNYKNILLSTASPYKFTKSVYESLTGTIEEDEFKAGKLLSKLTGTKIPGPIQQLQTLPEKHLDVIEKEDIENYVRNKAVHL